MLKKFCWIDMEKVLFPNSFHVNRTQMKDTKRFPRLPFALNIFQHKNTDCCGSGAFSSGGIF